jgi:hypothetical protein
MDVSQNWDSLLFHKEKSIWLDSFELPAKQNGDITTFWG